jgi:hypothetical protein
MHGTLLYPLPGRTRFVPSGRSGMRMPKLTPGLRKRIRMWKQLLLAELLRRVRNRPR